MLQFDDVIIQQGSFALSADVSVATGRTCAVIGPSGAGKSTLLGAIGGFIPVTQGAIRWGDTDMTHAPPGDRPLAMLFQDNNLFPHLSVAQNVGLGLRAALKLNADETARVAQAVHRVGLDGLEYQRPAQLSGGQQSRAALARILVQDKPLVLLDEPFSALGPALRAEMLDLVAELVKASGATLLMVTHAPEDALRIADDLIFVGDGTAHAPVPAADTLKNPPPELQAYLG